MAEYDLEELSMTIASTPEDGTSRKRKSVVSYRYARFVNVVVVRVEFHTDSFGSRSDEDRRVRLAVSVRDDTLRV